MPEICRFYGIIIKIFYDDHNPPHFHAEYGSNQMVLDIKTLVVIAGKLPPRAMGLVMEWASLHQSELLSVWNQAKRLSPPDSIDPLP